MNPVLIGLAVILALSLGGNVFLFNSRDEALAAKATQETVTASWKGSAEACSASVETLGKDGKRRHAELLGALEKEAGRIKGLQHEALEAARARPDDPKDLCGSLLRYWQAQIKRERGGTK